MSSLLKILVDVNCQVYCDYEFKGEATPGSIYRIEMRKGKYILEFKQGDNCLISQEFEMKSNDEDCLLRLSLAEIAEKYQREDRYNKIESLDVVVISDHDGRWLVNRETREKVSIKYNIQEISNFDKCGLLYVNIGGECYWDYDDGVIIDIYAPFNHYYAYKGGKWGCINKLGEVQIPIIYDKPIYFRNPYATVAELNGKKLFINKWGESVYEDLYQLIEDEKPFVDGYCIVVKGLYSGIIDNQGNFIVPLGRYRIKRSNLFSIIWVREKNRLGIFSKGCDVTIMDILRQISSFKKEGSVEYSCQFKDIEVCDDAIIAVQDGNSIVFDFGGRVVLNLKYSLVRAYYQLKLPNEGYIAQAQVVLLNGKFGCLNTATGDFKYITTERCREMALDIHEAIPCEYDYVADLNYKLFSANDASFSGDLCFYNRTKLPLKEIRYFVRKAPFGELNYYYYEDDGELFERLFPNPQSYYLFIDTETTGLICSKDDNNQKDMPYLVQVAMLFYDKDFNIIAEKNIIVAPDNYTIPIESTKVHGITNEYAIINGKQRKQVMGYLKSVFDTVNVIIGHNLDFDLSVIEEEFYRELFKGVVTFPYFEYGDEEWPNRRFYKAEKLIDTMKIGAEICKIPSTKKGEKYKWPKLDELYRSLFDKSFQGQHNALNDVKATEECFEELRRRKLIK